MASLTSNGKPRSRAIRAARSQGRLFEVLGYSSPYELEKMAELSGSVLAEPQAVGSDLLLLFASPIVELRVFDESSTAEEFPFRDILSSGSNESPLQPTSLNKIAEYR
jgi:hypothetical protein